jgi:hypothetical protein
MKEPAILFAYRSRAINRAGLVVRPRQPYVDQANSVDDDGPRANLQELREEPSIYLVEAVKFVDHFPDLIDKHWGWIFQEQLNSWMCDPALWPERLTQAMFLEWFDCELSTMIWDMLKAKINPMS